MIKSFSFSRIPEIYFGTGKLEVLPEKIKYFGKNILLVTGKSSFIKSSGGNRILNKLSEEKINFEMVQSIGEPSVKFIDEVCEKYKNHSFNVVVSIGGGSVIDAGKAISAMLTIKKPVAGFLEGNSSGKIHPGTKIPFIAVPTTAGTGSEATKNAVLSDTGENGFKLSLRHDNFVPDFAIIDPELTLQCPPNISAASGLDAFTQLFEAYTSSKATSLSDAIALEGMKKVIDSLTIAFINGSDIDARSDMSYAALLSGIALVNAGLGAIHGFASSIGGLFDIPHGVICGTLLGVVNRKNIQKILKFESSNEIFLKYSGIGQLFTKETRKPGIFYIQKLALEIDQWIEELKIPRLGEFGIKKEHIDKIIAKTGIKNNPVPLSKEELADILRERI